jgi:LCP family protein required for cell wall assembly
MVGFTAPVTLTAPAYRVVNGYPSAANSQEGMPRLDRPLMFGFTRSRAQARQSARTRRLQAAMAREERLRRKGIHTGTWREDLAAARDASLQADARRGEPVAGTVPVRRVLGWGFLLLFAGLLVAVVLLWQRADAFNRAVSSAPSLSSALLGPLAGTERVNIGFYGYAGREGHGGRYLADSLNILSIDPATDTTSIIPIPRDLWVEGHALFPENAKVNEAFDVGWTTNGLQGAGAAQTDVLRMVTGLRIDHWIALDFDGLAAVVDAVGGITIDNPRAFEYTLNEVDFHNRFFDGGSFAAGPIQLNGEQALSYARARYTSDPAEVGDFARSVRQQRVLSALRTKIGDGLPGSIGPGLVLMDALSTHMATDLSVIDLALMSGHLSPDQRIELKEGVILQATTTTDGRYVLVVIGRATGADYSPLHAYLATELARPVPTPVPSVAPSRGS